MKASQTTQELDQIQRELQAYLSPCVLDFTNAANINMLAGYLQAHNSKDGIVDASFANFQAAIIALKGSLVWTNAPVSKPTEQSSRLQQLNHNKKPESDAPAKKTPMQLAADDARKMNVRAIWDQCAAVATSWQGRTHGATYKGREKLKAIVTKAHTGADPLNMALAQATLALDCFVYFVVVLFGVAEQRELGRDDGESDAISAP